MWQIPKDLRELFFLVSPEAMQAIKWRPFLKDLKGVLSNFVRRTSNSGLEAELSELLKPHVEISNKIEGITISELDPYGRNKLGDMLLEIYFTQLFSERGLFLDLRLSNFEWGEKLLWKPTPLYAKFDDDFRRSLIQLYEGFYSGNEEMYQTAIVDLGLAEEGKTKNVETILKKHFGSSVEEPIIFSTKYFFESFKDLFKLIKTEKRMLNYQFVFLGAYLASLYLSLEKLGRPQLVRDVFFRVLKKQDRKSVV